MTQIYIPVYCCYGIFSSQVETYFSTAYLNKEDAEKELIEARYKDLSQNHWSSSIDQFKKAYIRTIELH